MCLFDYISELLVIDGKFLVVGKKLLIGNKCVSMFSKKVSVARVIFDFLGALDLCVLIWLGEVVVLFDTVEKDDVGDCVKAGH